MCFYIVKSHVRVAATSLHFILDVCTVHMGECEQIHMCVCEGCDELIFACMRILSIQPVLHAKQIEWKNLSENSVKHSNLVLCTLQR